MGETAGQLRARIEVRMAELRAEIAALEAVGAGTNEPVIRLKRGQLAELETLLAGDADWRARVQERKARVIDAVGEFTQRRKR